MAESPILSVLSCAIGFLLIGAGIWFGFFSNRGWGNLPMLLLCSVSSIVFLDAGFYGWAGWIELVMGK